MLKTKYKPCCVALFLLVLVIVGPSCAAMTTIRVLKADKRSTIFFERLSPSD